MLLFFIVFSEASNVKFWSVKDFSLNTISYKLFFFASHAYSAIHELLYNFKMM